MVELTGAIIELACAVIEQAVEDWKGRFKITSLNPTTSKQFYYASLLYKDVQSAYKLLTTDNIWWSVVNLDREYICSKLNVTRKDMEEYERIFERLRYRYHTMYEQRQIDDNKRVCRNDV